MSQHRTEMGRFEIIGVIESGPDHERIVQLALAQAGERVPARNQSNQLGPELFKLPNEDVAVIRSGFADSLKAYLKAEGVDAAFYDKAWPEHRKFRFCDCSSNPVSGVR